MYLNSYKTNKSAVKLVFAEQKLLPSEDRSFDLIVTIKAAFFHVCLTSVTQSACKPLTIDKLSRVRSDQGYKAENTSTNSISVALFSANRAILLYFPCHTEAIVLTFARRIGNLCRSCAIRVVNLPVGIALLLLMPLCLILPVSIASTATQ